MLKALCSLKKAVFRKVKKKKAKRLKMSPLTSGTSDLRIVITKES